MFPFILSPHSRALQPLCSIALRHSRTSHASFCPHKGLLSFNLHFLSFMSSRCVIGFRAHRLAKAVCSQHRCKVLCDSCNVSQCNLVAKQGSSFTIHNMCKQNTCCWHVATLPALTWSMGQLIWLKIDSRVNKYGMAFLIFLRIPSIFIFPCCPHLLFCWSTKCHIFAQSSSFCMTEACLQGADPVKEQGYSLAWMSCVHAMGNFMGSTLGCTGSQSPSSPNPSSNISLVYWAAVTAAFSSLRCCLPPVM